MAENARTQPVITASQLLLHTLNGAGEPLPVHDLMCRARRVADRLRALGLEVGVSFRDPYNGNVWSEQLEESLWRWLANGFIEEGPLADGRLRLSPQGPQTREDPRLWDAIHRGLLEDTQEQLAKVAREAAGDGSS